MRTPKPMSLSFTRKVHRRVEPLATWYADVCSVLAGILISSAPCTLMPFHCSSLAAMSRVSRAEPLQATLLTSARTRCMLPLPFAQTSLTTRPFSLAYSSPCCVRSETASMPLCVFSDTTLAVSFAYSRPFWTRSDSASSAVFCRMYSTLCCTRSFSETFSETFATVVPTRSLIFPSKPPLPVPGPFSSSGWATSEGSSCTAPSGAASPGPAGAAGCSTTGSGPGCSGGPGGAAAALAAGADGVTVGRGGLAAVAAVSAGAVESCPP
mmetsp:Transcript_5417/g.16027  ORF Transcript_5417/g.16027 Transcript_5417/m.16027 type:complete len:267 (-) Transcript_5417:82-882(-)